jgi:O-antigen ligase
MYPVSQRSGIFNVNRLIELFTRFCSVYALILCAFAVIIVLSSYIFGLFQPVRWPSLIYFLVALFITLLSARWALSLIIFSLPLLPGLHIQLSHIRSPAVPYFINYPGIDIIVGYTIGLLALRLADKSNGMKLQLLPLWPAGLVLLVTTASTAVAVWRNLDQINSGFSFAGLLNNALRFKLIDRLNDYFPVVDLLVYAVALLFFALVVQALKQAQNANEIIFKPLVLGSAFAALWGIMQAITSFGLPLITIEYRPAGIGFGAIGFQPDIHAFGAHMLVGTVGLLGYLLLPHSRPYRNAIILVLALCCGALILSKSRASAFLFVAATAVYLILLLKQLNLTTRVLQVLACFGLVVLVVAFSQSFAWLQEINAALESANSTWFQKINQISRYRLEIFTAALRMFAAVPFFGIGSGNFFRASRHQDFSGTAWFIAEGGENAYIDLEGGDHAHNYFLQTLVEMGLLGFLVCAFFFLYPLIFRAAGSHLRPAIWALVAIALGNVYSHSLIIRDNLFLLAAVSALLYAEACCLAKVGQMRTSLSSKYQALFKTPGFLLCGFLLLSGLAVKEVIGSFNPPLISVGNECMRPTQAIGADGWSSGIYKVEVSTSASQLLLHIDQFGGAELGEPRTLKLAWYSSARKLLGEQSYQINPEILASGVQITAKLPATVKISSNLITAVLTYDACDTPANHSFSGDHRRLAFKVSSAVEF